MTVKATYLLTIEGPGDFDFDLEEAAGAIGRVLVSELSEPENITSIELARVSEPGSAE